MIKKVRDVFEGVDTRHELEALLSLAWPSYLISLSFTGIGLINSSVVGHLVLYESKNQSSAVLTTLRVQSTSLLLPIQIL